MKTIKAFLKDFLSGRAGRSRKESQNKSKLLTSKNNQDETETDESARNPVVDNSDARENLGTGEELQTAARTCGRETRGVVDNDGIPHFRGVAPSEFSSSDIFSLAREA